MKKKGISRYEKLDREILGLAQRAQSLGYLEAVNSREEREKFLRGKIKSPRFIYKDPPYSVDKLNSELTGLSIPDDEIGSLYKGLVRELYLRNEIVANLGNRKIAIRNSELLYGRPSKRLLKLAQRTLRIFIKQPEFNNHDIKEMNYKDIKRKLNRYLKRRGIKGWSVSGTNQHSVAVGALRKIIKVSRYKRYSMEALKLLKAHEINGHVLRAENGYEQPFRIFVIGLPSYIVTEEGLAAYLEDKFKVKNLSDKARFALRVIAVDSVYQGMKFNQCFELLNSYEKDRDKCWDITYRVFRGGGFLKDHVYFKGYYMIKDYIRKKGKLKYLYIGKIGLKDLKLVKMLVKKGILKKPKYLPEKVIK